MMTGQKENRLKVREKELVHGETVFDITETIPRKFDKNPIIRTEVIHI